MTAPARITMADMDRAAKIAAKLGPARIIMRLATAEIEIITGETGPPPRADEWSDDDR